MASNETPEPRIRYIDIADERKEFAVAVAQRAFAAHQQGHHSTWQEVAAFIKHELDQKFGPQWQVVVGPNFGSFVTHEHKSIIYFFLQNMGVLVWKHG